MDRMYNYGSYDERHGMVQGTRPTPINRETVKIKEKKNKIKRMEPRTSPILRKLTKFLSYLRCEVTVQRPERTSRYLEFVMGHTRLFTSRLAARAYS